MRKENHAFWVIVNKEISDHVKSWRFIILVSIIALTCLGSLYTALSNIGAAIKPDDPDGWFLFLKLFTASDGTLPSFVMFVSFLGPLLGIALGFDAVNSEQNKGTLSRLLSQPIYRDNIINAKFFAALIVVSILFFVLGLLVMGCGLVAIGIPPTADEFLRIILFIVFPASDLFGSGSDSGLDILHGFLCHDRQCRSQCAEPFADGLTVADHRLPEIYSRADATGSQRTLRGCRDDPADAFGQKSRASDHDGGTGSHSQPAPAGTEPVDRMETAHGVNSRHDDLFRRFICVVHAAGNPVQIKGESNEIAAENGMALSRSVFVSGHRATAAGFRTLWILGKNTLFS